MILKGAKIVSVSPILNGFEYEAIRIKGLQI